MKIKNAEGKPLIDLKPVVGGAILFIQVQGEISEIAAELNKMQEGNWEVSLSKVKKKKTLDQVGYAWALIDKLAVVLKRSPKEVYRELIRDIPGVSEIVCVQEKAAQDLIKIWESRGVGWQIESFPSKIEGCVNLRLFYGASVYDTTQMSALIDRIEDECKTQGIPTGGAEWGK